MRARAAMATSLLVLAAVPAAATVAPPHLIAVDVRVTTAQRVVEAQTIVADPAGYVLQRRYQTTLMYRCARHWQLAARTGVTIASTALDWHYPNSLRGHRCDFRLTVRRVGGGQAVSAVISRRL
jgi:hypothetical protein